ncbi:hypothetical protein IL306_008951, partial [Fusarium sp. DS 682]
MLCLPTTSFDGSHEPSEYVNASKQITHRIKSWNKLQVNTGSAVADLIDEETNDLEADLDALLSSIGPSAANDPPLSLGDDLNRTKIRITNLMELMDFYRRHKASGQLDALNALFASEYILCHRDSAETLHSWPREQELENVAVSFTELLGRFPMKEATSVTKAEAIRSFEEN